MTLYIATDFHPIQQRSDQKMQNKWQNILFIVIISIGEYKNEKKNKNKETCEVLWDKSGGDENRKLKDEVHYI